jgi:hypothetical protein
MTIFADTNTSLSWEKGKSIFCRTSGCFMEGPPTDKSEAITTDKLDVPTGMLEVAVCQCNETQPKAQLFPL